MGRAKLKMNLIEKKKSRALTYNKRSQGLVKKMEQLTTLCGVTGCIIIKAPADDQYQNFFWSNQNSDELIQLYQSKSREIGGVKTYRLADFFEDRQRKTEQEVARLRKQNVEARYPSWNQDLDLMTGSQLRALAAALRDKARSIRFRIHDLLLKQQVATNNNDMMMMMIANPNFNQFKPLLDMPQSNCGGAGNFEAAVVQLAGHHQYYVPPMPQPKPYMLQYSSTENHQRYCNGGSGGSGGVTQNPNFNQYFYAQEDDFMQPNCSNISSLEGQITCDVATSQLPVIDHHHHQFAPPLLPEPAMFLPEPSTCFSSTEIFSYCTDDDATLNVWPWFD